MLMDGWMDARAAGSHHFILSSSSSVVIAVVDRHRLFGALLVSNMRVLVL